jgi:hypothetical protein
MAYTSRPDVVRLPSTGLDKPELFRRRVSAFQHISEPAEAAPYRREGVGANSPAVELPFDRTRRHTIGDVVGCAEQTIEEGLLPKYGAYLAPRRRCFVS